MYLIINFKDIDECSTNASSCHAMAECVDTEGNYTCHCITGYTGDGFVSCTSKSKSYSVSCPVWTQNNTIYPTVQTLMSVSSTWTTVTTMLTVLTLLGASTVPVCLVTLELDSSVVCDYPLARICSKGYNSCLICLSFIHSVC